MNDAPILWTKYDTVTGQAIANIRQRTHTTQQALAERTGMKQSYIARVESGDIPMTVNTLFAIAGPLGTTASAIADAVETSVDMLAKHGIHTCVIDICGERVAHQAVRALTTSAVDGIVAAICQRKHP